MNSFFRGVARGRFPRLDDREDLWKLLVTITARKVVAAKRRRFTKNEAGLQSAASLSSFQRQAHTTTMMAWLKLSREPSPDFAVEVADTCEHLMRKLDDESLRRIALLKMESHTNEEVGRLQHWFPPVRTVERKLARIRDLWSREDFRMGKDADALTSISSSSLASEIEPVADAFEKAWQSNTPPAIEAFVQHVSGTTRTALVSELVMIDMERRWRLSY